MDNREETFDLKAGESRDDIAFMVGVHRDKGGIEYWQNPPGEIAVGGSIEAGGVIRLERIE